MNVRHRSPRITRPLLRLPVIGMALAGVAGLLAPVGAGAQGGDEPRPAAAPAAAA